MSKNQQDHGLMTGLILGGTAGALLGLVLAPRPGKETRELLKKAAQALPDLVTDFSETMQNRTNRQWQLTVQKLQRAIAAGIAASQSEIPAEHSFNQGNRD